MKLNLREIALALVLSLAILGAIVASNTPASAALGVATCGVSGCVSTPPLSSSTSYSYSGTSTVQFTTTSSTISSSISSSTTTTTATTTSTSWSYTSSHVHHHDHNFLFDVNHWHNNKFDHKLDNPTDNYHDDVSIHHNCYGERECGTLLPSIVCYGRQPS